MLWSCNNRNSTSPGLSASRPFCAPRRIVAGQAGGTFQTATMKNRIPYASLIKHSHCLGGKHTRTYHAWEAAKQRCYNPNTPNFKDYGGRGIRMCRRWRNSFANFLHDMGPKPEGLTLDRKNNNGNYTPTNCRWATRKQQSNNRRSCRFIRFNGQTKNISQWAKFTGIGRRTLARRIDEGCSLKSLLDGDDLATSNKPAEPPT